MTGPAPGAGERTRAAPSGEKPAAPGELGIDLERIIFFSDAVFAIAITLLALEIRLPDDVLRAVAGDFGALWNALLPEIFSYVVTFTVVGTYWIAHHRYFHYIRDFDYGLIWRNLAFLLCIAFLPVPAGMLGEYGNQPPVVVLYAGTLALVGVLAGLLWWHATWDHRLVDADLSADIIRYNLARAWLPPLVFLLSIVIALMAATYLAEYSWLSIGVITFALNRFQPRTDYAKAGPGDV